MLSMESHNRVDKYKKIDEVEEILDELNRILELSKCDDISEDIEITHPIVFVVGAARSGTTLLMQSLIHYGEIAYPSNIMSRFYKHPYFGSLLHKLFVDLDFKEEFLLNNDIHFTSDLGKTKGASSPHEFWYFWNEYFRFGEIQQLSAAELSQVDIEGFIGGIGSIMRVFNKPVFMKASNMNWHVDYLLKAIPNSHILHIERDIRFNAQSLLLARKEFFGKIDSWYSFKPPNYSELIKMTATEQVLHQVSENNRAIKSLILDNAMNRYTHITYEELCADPLKVCNNVLNNLKITVSQQSPYTLISQNKKSEYWPIIVRIAREMKLFS